MKPLPHHSSHRHQKENPREIDNHLTSWIRWGGVRGGARKPSPIKLKIVKLEKQILSLLVVLPMLNPLQTYVLERIGKTQFDCVNKLWIKESNWNHKAVSPTHDYGIPQRHMKNKSKKEIEKFLSDPHKQIDWGLGYIAHRYGSPCQAWSHSQRKGWY